MRPYAGGFVIPLTFSEHAAWYQNVRAAREAVVTYAGRDQVVTRPEVIDYAAAAAFFPRYERAQFRLLGISSCSFRLSRNQWRKTQCQSK